MKAKELNFTKKSLELIKPPIKPEGKSGGVYDTYKDTQEKGLRLIVSNGGAKTFYLYKKIDGKPERIKIGSFPDKTVAEARGKASELKGLIANNKNPKKNSVDNSITFEKLFDKYINEYSKSHKKTWKQDIAKKDLYLTKLLKKKLYTIDSDDIRKVHSSIADNIEEGQNKKIYAANRTLELLRSIFNFAIDNGSEIENPCIKVKPFKEKSRDRFLQPDELAEFFKSLEQELNQTAKDYIYLSLLTGARRSNILSMKWEDINLDRNEWKIPETKNGESQLVPLVPSAIEILKTRKEENDNAEKYSKYVFPSDSRSGHYTDPKRAWKRILERATIEIWRKDNRINKLIEETQEKLKDKQLYSFFNEIKKEAERQEITLPKGITDLRLHDLRRTLGSFQASLGANSFIIGKSLGHKSQSATAIYSRLNLDPVRASMEAATNEIMRFRDG